MPLLSNLIVFVVMATLSPGISSFCIGNNSRRVQQHASCWTTATTTKAKAPRVPVFLSSSSSSSSSSSEPSAPPILLTAEKVVELIDVSFVNACMQLAMGYVDVLKLFIAAVKAGYDMGLSPIELIAKMDDIPNPTAGRPFLPEEVTLRNTWIQVVYMTLAASTSTSSLAASSTDTTASTSIAPAADVDMILDDNIQVTYGSILPIMTAMKTSGESLDIHSFLERHYQQQQQHFDFHDATQKAIVTHSLRVMWITLTVLEEEDRCLGEFARPDGSSPIMPPTPPIAGAF